MSILTVDFIQEIYRKIDIILSELSDDDLYSVFDKVIAEMNKRKQENERTR